MIWFTSLSVLILRNVVRVLPWRRDLTPARGRNFGTSACGQKKILADRGICPQRGKTGAQLLFKLLSQRYERVATLITSNGAIPEDHRPRLSKEVSEVLKVQIELFEGGPEVLVEDPV
jgi:hypothetical protein